MTNIPDTPKRDSNIIDSLDLNQKVLAWMRYRVAMDVLDLIRDEIGERECNVLREIVHEALLGRFDWKDWDPVLDRIDAYQQVVSLQSALVSTELS
jgi:hypothetical protein